MVERAHDLVQLPPCPAHVVHLCLELLVPLLERRELLERQRVHRPKRDQLALQLVCVLRERRAFGCLGLGHPDQVLRHRSQVAVHVLDEGLGPQVDLVGFEVERARAGADRIEALFGGVAVLTELLELLTARPDGVHLVLIVVTQGLEDAVEARMLLFHQRLQPAQRAPSDSSRWRRVAAVARSSAWPCSRRSTSASRSVSTRRRSATPATRTSAPGALAPPRPGAPAGHATR